MFWSVLEDEAVDDEGEYTTNADQKLTCVDEDMYTEQKEIPATNVRPSSINSYVNSVDDRTFQEIILLTNKGVLKREENVLSKKAKIYLIWIVSFGVNVWKLLVVV